MLIQEKHVLQAPVSAMKNFQDPILNKSESSFECKQAKISKIFYTSIDFSPLVNFINKGDITFEFLLHCAEQDEKQKETSKTKDVILKISDTSDSVIIEHAYAKPIENASIKDVQNGKNLTEDSYNLRRSKRIAKRKLTMEENSSRFIEKPLPKKQKASSPHLNY